MPDVWCAVELHRFSGVIACAHSTDADIHELVSSYYYLSLPCFRNLTYSNDLRATLKARTSPMLLSDVHDFLKSIEVADLMFSLHPLLNEGSK